MEAAAAHYLPMFCESRQRTRLQPSVEGVAMCAACGKPARIVPGALYGEADVERFDAIDAALRATDVPERDGRRVATLLSDVTQRTQAPLLALNRVLDFLPALRFLQPETAEDFAALPRLLGIIDTIIGARLRGAHQVGAPRNIPSR